VSLAEGAGAPGKNPPGSVMGYTDFGGPGYGGMAPPPGDPPHHYTFNVYALDKKLDLPPSATGAYFMFAIRGAILAHGKIGGTFGR
jgi:Raf kinase inhibitor-like YbhB/YbcL family protein